MAYLPVVWTVIENQAVTDRASTTASHPVSARRHASANGGGIAFPI